MMLRRLKEDVEKNLAAKEETIIEVLFQFLDSFLGLEKSTSPLAMDK